MREAAKPDLERGWRLALFAALAVLAAFLFHRYGVTGAGYNANVATRSLFVWTSQRWVVDTAYFNDFPYGWLAPLMSLWMVWRIRRELAAADRGENWLGFVLVLAALLAQWIGARTQQPRISAAAFLLLLWAVPFHCFGARVARMLVVPVGFLLFTIPFDLLSGVVLRMRVFATAASSALLCGLGVPMVVADPTTLRTTSSPAYAIALSTHAGGIRSLMYITAAAVLLAWMRQRGPVRQVLLLAGVPMIVFCAGVLRTVAEGFGWSMGGTKAAELLGAAPTFYALAGALLFFWHRAVTRLSWPGGTAP